MNGSSADTAIPAPAPVPTRTSGLGIAVAALVLIGLAALLLHHFRRDQRLGPPGLKFCDVQLTNEVGEVVATNSLYLPERVGDFASVLLPVQKVELAWLPPDTSFGRRLYQSQRDGYQIQVSGVMMGTDRTSIHKPEFCLPAQGFQIVSRRPLELDIERPHAYRLPVMRIDALREYTNPNGNKTRQGAVYVYWFVSGNRLSNSHTERMWWLARDLVATGELGRWAYLGVLGACHPGEEDAAYGRLADFIRRTVPEFQTTVGLAGTASPVDSRALRTARLDPEPRR